MRRRSSRPAPTGAGPRYALPDGRLPDLDTSRRIGLAYADSGADLVEFGVPFSDPLADGPVIHAAGTVALRAGVRLHDVLGVGRAIAERVPVVVMCYANLIFARGVSASPTSWSRPALAG